EHFHQRQKPCSAGFITIFCPTLAGATKRSIPTSHHHVKAFFKLFCKFFARQENRVNLRIRHNNDILILKKKTQRG
ncbi:MAG: hypothetical protein FWB96_09785, partial [Defluviitaleaceae bacterium]|nr:hypothetical protein [Defluviitaleaceae bacterium]MCL2263191.1 hypothetical protein [Defluviitaleaceae bacterium]